MSNVRFSVYLTITVIVMVELLLQFMYSNTAIDLRLSMRPKSSGFSIVDPNIEPDSVIGYHFRKDSHSRYAYFVDGRREIDFVMKVNNKGLPSHFDFRPKKDSATVRRYLVFGDSFSAGVLMDTTWVDHVNVAVKERGLPLELHNYSVDGGGMRNWYNIFRHGLKEGYEYDGVILAIYIDNLNRMFVSMWSDDGCVPSNYFADEGCVRFNYFERPENIADEGGQCFMSAYSAENFTRIEEHFIHGHISSRPFPIILSLLKGELQWGDPYKRGQRKYYSQYIDNGETLPFHRLNERYYPMNLAMLDTMVSTLASNGKELVIAIISDRYMIERKRRMPGFTALYEADIDTLADHYGITTIINGNDEFLRFNSVAIQAMWLTGDMHWNAHGARTFSKVMVDRLTSGNTVLVNAINRSDSI